MGVSSGICDDTESGCSLRVTRARVSGVELKLRRSSHLGGDKLLMHALRGRYS